MRSQRRGGLARPEALEQHARVHNEPDARLYRKSNSTAATWCYAGHLLIEHRNALIVDAELTTADGYAEGATAIGMLARLPRTSRRRTVAGAHHPPPRPRHGMTASFSAR
jgi:hypothetical protein